MKRCFLEVINFFRIIILYSYIFKFLVETIIKEIEKTNYLNFTVSILFTFMFFCFIGEIILMEKRRGIHN